MKKTLLRKADRLDAPLASLKLALSTVAAVAVVTCAQGQIQTAGTLFINVDATALTAGPLANNYITNSGALGGVFQANTETSVGTAAGVNAVVLGGTNYLVLTNRAGGGLIPPPGGLVGPNATCSIEVWALNPQVAGDEPMVAWGQRAAGQNMAFEYGNGSSGGAQHNGNDMVWDPKGGGCPLNNYWHHLVYTFDGTNQNLYADGVLANSIQPPAFNVATNASIALGAQWTNTGTAISTSPGFATLSLARVRVHDGVLTAAQVLNNYNYEAATFAPPTVTPAYLSSGPAHRYSFSEPATNDATGLTFHDSVGAADGSVQSSQYNEVAQFSGRRLVLTGGIQTIYADYGAAYGALPGGLLSANSTNNGGSGEFSVEIWWKNTGGYPLQGYTGTGEESWCRVFDFGSCGTTNTMQGSAVPAPGDYPNPNGTYLDYFIYAGQVGAGYSCVNQRQLGWQKHDTLPAGSTTNAGAITLNVQTMGTYQTDRHVVVTWQESTGLITAYENGLQVASITASNSMSAFNDVDLWLGRSHSLSDRDLAGEYDEVRLYTNVLTPGQVLGNFQVGPNTVNTGPQAARIITQPQNATIDQGWPATFYVEASGSPAVSYQWSRNAVPIPGATTDTYSLAAVALTNNGDVYVCTVSNATTAAFASSSATLTVVANQAAPVAIYHETKDSASGSARDNYSGVVGSYFEAGAAGALVTHLGYYDYEGHLLNVNHRVGIFNANGSTILGYVTVSNFTTGDFLTNGYAYVALDPPLFLAPNTYYILEAETVSGDSDPWADLWTPALWNPYFVGTNGPSTRQGRYGGSWPSGATGVQGSPTIYGAPNMATFPIGPAVVIMPQTAVTQYVNLSITLNVLANGQAPLTLQWYQGDPPNGTLLPGQTSSSLVFPNVQSTNAGDYYVVAGNSLNTATSSVVTLTVFNQSPVTITQQPTNTSVFQGYTAAFSIGAAGTPPIFYQWNHNGTNLPGATNSSLITGPQTLANNGDLYSCIVSNFANGSGHTLTSSNATLSVIPNQAPLSEVLYGYVPGYRNNYEGTLGGNFTVGNANATVTHLGYYCTNLSVGLNSQHNVGVFNASGSALLASVVIPSGPSPAGVYATNGYAWVALPTPLVLSNNTTYVLAGDVHNGDGDVWPDVFIPSDWNPYYVGTNGPGTRNALYSGGGAQWPTPPLNLSSANGIYGPPNLAILAIGAPVVTMLQTNVSQYQGLSVTLSAVVDGQPPLNVQWYKVGPPDQLLTNQTSTSLVLSNLTLGQSGNYYLIATNAIGSTQGGNVSLVVLATSGPVINSQPQSQSVYPNQVANFTVGVSGTPPLSYQWTFKASGGNTTNPIAGATNSTLALTGVTAANAGNYQVTVTNAYGATNSAVATLTLLTVPAGSYPAAVLNSGPLVYYRFSDVTNGTGALNLGSLGSAYNGTYEGAFTNGPGPQPPAFPNFESTNMALVLDGATVDVSIPALNLDTNSGPSMTMAAWIYEDGANGLETNYAGIIFHRPIGQAFASGIGVTADGNNPAFDELEYHWDNLYYGFASGLDVPTNQWVFVALAVDPNQATLYLYNGLNVQTATNVAPHGAVPFDDVTYVGWDDNDLGGSPPNSTTRRFFGSIDEPMIIGRTLAASELDALYLAAFPPLQLQIAESRGQIVLSWPMGTLQHASQVTGPYTDISGATSPYTNAPSGTMQYYRVRVPLQ